VTISEDTIEEAARPVPARGVRGRSAHRRRGVDVWYLAVMLLVAGKSIVVGISTVGISSWPTAVAGAVAAAAVLTAPALLFGARKRPVVLVLLNLAATAILLADVVFHGWFGTLAPVTMLSQAGQVGGVTSSVRELLHPVQLLLVGDLVVLFVLALIGRARRAGRGSPKAMAVVLVLALALLAATAASSGRQDLVERHATSALGRAVTPLAFHLLDVAMSAAGVHEEDLSPTQLEAWQRTRPTRVVPEKLAGVARGSNVLTIQLEAMMGYLIGREVGGEPVTPTLNALVKDQSLSFTDAYSPIGSGNTSDAEMMTLTSLLPLDSGAAFVKKAENRYPGSLPKLLKANGYARAEAFHGYDRGYYNRGPMYKALGFDAFHAVDDYDKDDEVGLGLSDASFYRQTAEKIAKLKAPWYSHVVSLSGHHPYRVPADRQPLDLAPGYYGEEFTDYLQAQAYADRALGEFLADLDRRGLLDDTTIVVYGDHWGQGWTHSDVERFTGRESTDYVDSTNDLRVPLLIRLPGGKHAKTYDQTVGTVDLTPTLLGLLGIEDRGFYFGRSMFAGGDLIPQRFYQPLGSFIGPERMLQANQDGGVEGGSCFDRESHAALPPGDCAKEYDETVWRLRASDSVFRGDLLPDLTRR